MPGPVGVLPAVPDGQEAHGAGGARAARSPRCPERPAARGSTRRPRAGRLGFAKKEAAVAVGEGDQPVQIEEKKRAGFVAGMSKANK
mmetsp:Transcript_13911/g.41143  ORF Transcript_13911/g.41143 Transcript_13911/m.41143 type:complete len:87 (-) Transcript_13911:299-559(-)